jgi:aminomethyltransferase
MKNTPLTPTHQALGAKMAEFAGYNMPISYTGIKDEHFAVRNQVGIFDVSHMGEFIVRGKEALPFLQYVTSNDVNKLQPGDVQYSCLPNLQGGIIDDLLVYRLPNDTCAEGEQAFMLVVNASNIQKDWNWLQQHNNFDTRLIDISDETCLLAVQGPLAAQALQPLTDIPLANMKYYTFAKGQFAGIDKVIVSATGYTGAGGFEIYAPAQYAETIWNQIMAAGKDFDIKPAGLGARDTLRLEMGYCLYGNDIDDTTSPIEAGLGWITKTKKGTFISSDIFRAQVAEGTKRRLAAFEMVDKGIPRHHYDVTDGMGNTIGFVTSGTQSPTLDRAIGLAYVPTAYTPEGSTIYIKVRDKELKANIVKLPFIQR